MIDFQRLRTGFVALAALLLTVSFVPEQLEAQQAGGRFRVLVANLQPADGTDDDFGRDVADELRDLIDLPTHVAMEDDDIDDAAREYDMRLNQLDCTFAQQLAGLIEVPMVFCGTYRTVDGMIEYDAKFVTVPGQEEFVVPSQPASQNDDQQVARQVMDFLESTIETVNQVAFCGMEYNSSNWDEALRYCTRAVELAPQSSEARSALARTYLELERHEESLEQFEALLEEDPYNSNALESAGYVASQIGQTDQARDYYARYLELNPENVQIRMRVAYDLAQAGDDLGAMELLEAGVEQAPDNLDLHERYGAMAARAGLQLQEERRGQQDPADGSSAPQIDPEVAELFRKAITSLSMVLEARGEESLPQYLINTMAAHIQLGEIDEALALGERGTQYFPRNAQVRSVLANAYNRSGDVDRAIATLQEGLELDPELSNAYSRVGQWLTNAGRIEEAGEALRTAAERGEQQPDALAQILFGYGYNQLHQQGEYDAAIRAYDEARSLDISSGLRSQVDFFHGYARFQQANAIQEAGTLEAAQRSLPLFQEALQRFNQGRQYGDSNPGANLDALIDNTNTFIEIQEAIIQRGR